MIYAMKLTAKTLPDDPHLLKQMLLVLSAENQQLSPVEKLNARVQELVERNRQLELLVRMMQMCQFGRSSENSAVGSFDRRSRGEPGGT